MLPYLNVIFILEKASDFFYLKKVSPEQEKKLVDLLQEISTTKTSIAKWIKNRGECSIFHGCVDADIYAIAGTFVVIFVASVAKMYLVIRNFFRTNQDSGYNV